ncbi:MAG: hypothetical protein U1G08_21435 [Verrucomicrobiota bacterium]
MKPGILLATLAVIFAAPLLAQQPAPNERVAALKAQMATSEAALKQYQWIRTTVISINGEEKSRKQERCYYGLDGKLTQVALTPEIPPQEPRGPLRRRIAEHKREELTDSMKEAVALIHQYLPPTPALIQSCKEAGKMTIQPLDSGKTARVTFNDYHQKGDSLSLVLDLSDNHPTSAAVKNALKSGKNPITLDAAFGTLTGGITYPSQYVLEAPSQKLKVSIENSGYQKAAP